MKQTYRHDYHLELNKSVNKKINLNGQVNNLKMKINLKHKLKQKWHFLCTIYWSTFFDYSYNTNPFIQLRLFDVHSLNPNKSSQFIVNNSRYLGHYQGYSNQMKLNNNKSWNVNININNTLVACGKIINQETAIYLF